VGIVTEAGDGPVGLILAELPWRPPLRSSPVSADGWEWDETLYAGSAAFYVRGRMPYPTETAVVLRDELGLHGAGRLLDVGCGPGSVTLVLADLFGEVVGVDADAEMLVEAGCQAQRRGCENATWVHLRAEELPAGLGTFRVVVFAQSFHWMDRARVAATVHAMLEPGGSLVHVGATTHEGVAGSDALPAPRPPRDEITDLVRRFLGPVPRAGRGRRVSATPSDEDEILAAAGFGGPRRLDVGGGRVVERSEDDIVASVHSLSSAAPHLFGSRLEAFDAELRQLLRRTAPAGRFCERTREITLAIWDR
jgi:SAM-dependent methyltransferase